MSHKDHTAPMRIPILKTVSFKIITTIFLSLTLLPLIACSSTNIEKGPSFTDLAASNRVIYLPDIVTLGADFDGASGIDDANPNTEPPSTDDLFIAKIVKSNITVDLLRRGYNVSDDPRAHYDLSLTMQLFYQPDDWPLANRTLHVRADVSKPQGLVIAHIETMRENWLGNLGDHLGFSGEKMMADTAQEIVDFTLSGQSPSK